MQTSPPLQLPLMLSPLPRLVLPSLTRRAGTIIDEMSVSTAHHPEGVLIVPSNFEIWVIGEDDEVFEYRVASEADLDCPAGPSASPTSAAPTKFPTPAAATLCDTSGMAATSFWGTTVSGCPGSSASVCVAYEQRNYDGGFGATCDGFCGVYGLVCSAAHHDWNHRCAISSTLQCDGPGASATSDHICTCKEASAVSLCDTSGMSAQPYWGSTVSECAGSSPSVCVAYQKRNYDGGFGATCDGFCGVYGLVCTAAHHDASDGCETLAPGEFSCMYRYISRESCSQFDSLPLTSLTIPPVALP